MSQTFLLHLAGEVPCHSDISHASHSNNHAVSRQKYHAPRKDVHTFRRCRGLVLIPSELSRLTAAAGRTIFEQGKAMDNYRDDFTRLDDSALLARRAEMRAELDRLPPASPGHAALAALYDRSTKEINDRARKAWSTANEEKR